MKKTKLFRKLFSGFLVFSILLSQSPLGSILGTVGTASAALWDGTCNVGDITITNPIAGTIQNWNINITWTRDIDCNNVDVTVKYSTNWWGQKYVIAANLWEDATNYSWDASLLDLNNVTLYVSHSNNGITLWETAAFNIITAQATSDLATAKTTEALLVSTDYVDYSAVTTALALPETTTTEAIAKTTAINNAIAGLVTKWSVTMWLITALPTVANLTIPDTLVAAARTSYDALSAAQKLLVTNLSTLTDAETQITALDAAEAATIIAEGTPTQANVDAANALMPAVTAWWAKTSIQGRINAVQATVDATDAGVTMWLITALPAVADLTIPDTLVAAARTSYDALSAAQKLLVTNYTTLTDAETQITALNAADTATATAEATPTQSNVDAANALMPAVTAWWAKTSIQGRIDAVQADVTAAKDTSDLITALPTVANLTIPDTLVAAARTSYDALSAAQKLLVTNYTTLTDAETQITALTNATAAVNNLETAVTALDLTQAKLEDTEAKLILANTALSSVVAWWAKTSLQGRITTASSTITTARSTFDGLVTTATTAVEAAEAATLVGDWSDTQTAITAAQSLDTTADGSVALIGAGTIKTTLEGRLTTNQSRIDATQTAFNTTSPFLTSISAWTITKTSTIISYTSNKAGIAKINYGLTSSYGFVTDQISMSASSNTITLAGLTCGTTYNYKLWAKDSFNNETNVSNTTFTTSDCDVIDTTAPTITPNATPVQNITKTTADIVFQSNENWQAKIHYGKTTSYNRVTEYQAVTANTDKTISLAELTCGTTYHYKIYAKDALNNEWNLSDAIFSTTACSSSTGITVNSISRILNGNNPTPWWDYTSGYHFRFDLTINNTGENTLKFKLANRSNSVTTMETANNTKIVVSENGVSSDTEWAIKTTLTAADTYSDALNIAGMDSDADKQGDQIILDMFYKIPAWSQWTFSTSYGIQATWE